MIGIVYEEKKNGVKLKSHEGKWRHQEDLFSAIAPIFTPGNFMTFRGEDGALIGFFFNGNEMINYASYDELKKLEATFVLKRDLEENLTENKSSKSQAKF